MSKFRIDLTLAGVTKPGWPTDVKILEPFVMRERKTGQTFVGLFVKGVVISCEAGVSSYQMTHADLEFAADRYDFIRYFTPEDSMAIRGAAE